MRQTNGFLFKKCRSAALVIVFFSGASVCSGAQETAADPMLTCLFDTVTPSAEALRAQAIAEKSAWVALKEEDLAHPFQGDAVLRNDKLAVVLRKNGQGAEVYALSPSGPSLRTVLSPKSAVGATRNLESLQILENNPAAVSVRAAFGSEKGQPLAITYRVTVGQITVQMDPAEGVDAIHVGAQTDFLVVPDFFADDLVYSGRSTKASSVGLPAENFYLHLSGGGTTIVTCIWQTNGRNTRALFSGEGNARVITGSEIECVPGKLVWAAIAECPASWHAAVIPTTTGQSDIVLHWQPPFPAKWRGNFATASEASRSWNFLDARNADYEALGLGKITYPCWFQGGAAHVSYPKTLPPAAANGDVPLVVYPIDRSQATPLDVFLLVDVMRSTLGMGPCQYVLDIEGLDAQSSPTPALVLEWAERLFKKKRMDKNADAVREKLAAMEKHIGDANRRIDEYAAFAEKLRASAGSGASDSAGIQTVVTEMETSIRDLTPARESQQRVKELSDQVAGLVGKEDWESQFGPIRDELCAIGSAQDRTLSTCRMALRRLKQRCLTQDASAPEGGAVVKQIDAMLGEAG